MSPSSISSHRPVDHLPLFDWRGAAAAVLLISGAASAHADDFTYYRSVAAFSQAAGGVYRHDFPVLNDERHQIRSPWDVGQTEFSVAGEFSELAVGKDGEFGPDQSYLIALGAPELFSIVVTPLQGGVYAMGFDMGTLFLQDEVGVSINGGAGWTEYVSPPSPRSTFIGIVSSVPITQVSFTGSNATELDMLDYYLPSAVPEPSSLALTALGLGLLWTRTRRGVLSGSSAEV